MAALKQLRDLGICSVEELNGRSLLYSMKPLSSLQSYVGAKIQKLTELSEQLSSLSENQEPFTVEEGEGAEVLKSYLELALRSQQRRWQIISPYDNALRFLPKSYHSYFKKVRAERQIVSETLWSNSRPTKHLVLQELLMRKPRYVPKELTTDIPSMMLAFDDKLLFVTGTKEPHSVLIQNEAIATTFQLIFEMAWQSRRDVKTS